MARLFNHKTPHTKGEGGEVTRSEPPVSHEGGKLAARTGAPWRAKEEEESARSLHAHHHAPRLGRLEGRHVEHAHDTVTAGPRGQERDESEDGGRNAAAGCGSR